MDRSLIYGAVSGIVESCFSHPIDFYKVKYQELVFNNRTQTKPNIISFMSSNIKNNGFFSLYRGFVPKILSIIPTRTAFWGVQDICNRKLPITHPIQKYTISGIIAGFCQTIVETPGEVFKIQMMSNKGLKSNIIRNSFNGFQWNAARNSAFCAAVCLSNNCYQSDNKIKKFMVNGTSAFMACIITQPLDFMKTKYQINDSNYKLSFIKAIKDYKFKIFSGALPRSYTGFVNMGIGSIIFNYLVNNYS